MLSLASKAYTTVHSYLSPAKDTPSIQTMETFAARLESFSIALATGKKRTSSAKGTKAGKWPHKNPSPDQVGATYATLLSELTFVARSSWFLLQAYQFFAGQRPVLLLPERPGWLGI